MAFYHPNKHLPSMTPGSQPDGKFLTLTFPLWGFPGGEDGKESEYSTKDLSSFPGLGRSLGEGNANPLQYSCLENPMDGGAWQRVGHN